MRKDKEKEIIHKKGMRVSYKQEEPRILRVKEKKRHYN